MTNIVVKTLPNTPTSLGDVPSGGFFEMNAEMFMKPLADDNTPPPVGYSLVIRVGDGAQYRLTNTTEVHHAVEAEISLRFG